MDRSEFVKKYGSKATPDIIDTFVHFCNSLERILTWKPRDAIFYKDIDRIISKQNRISDGEKE